MRWRRGCGRARRGRAALPAPRRARGVTFLDVGQGDATLLQDRGHAILVDTGPPDGPIVARLRHAGVRRLDALVVTHAQDDHDGGGAAVLGALPGRAACSTGATASASPRGWRWRRARGRGRVADVPGQQGQRLRAGGIALQVLWPPAREPGAPPAGGQDPNQRAIVALATLGGMRVLLTADAESDVLAPLGLGAVDVLKVSHHGSADDGPAGAAADAAPAAGAASRSARDNTLGHPVPATVAALRAAGARVVRTDRDGSVAVEPRAAGRAVRHACLAWRRRVA